MSDASVDVLLDFVRHNLLGDTGAPITPSTPLLSDGLIDSMGVTLLAAFVEERFGVRFDDTEVRAGRLETIAAIAAVIARRR